MDGEGVGRGNGEGEPVNCWIPARLGALAMQQSVGPRDWARCSNQLCTAARRVGDAVISWILRLGRWRMARGSANPD